MEHSVFMDVCRIMLAPPSRCENMPETRQKHDNGEKAMRTKPEIAAMSTAARQKSGEMAVGLAPARTPALPPPSLAVL
jgi:hypothetical protein